MHNIKEIRTSFDNFKKKIQTRNVDLNLDIILDLDVRNSSPTEFHKEAVQGRRMFYEWIQQYDERRGTNFVKTFPEMNKFLKDCRECMI